MTIQERLKRSNLIMLVVPVAIAGVLLAIGLGGVAWLLETTYLPRFGLTLHAMGEELELLLKDMRLLVALYAAVVAAALLAAVGFTNFYLTRALFAHIQAPLDTLVQGVQRVRDGDLDSPIGYTEADEFRPACDAVDEMTARLRESLDRQQREQQKKQELLAGMSHDLKSPLAAIRAYTEALLEGVAPDEAARQRYLQTIYARGTDLEALVNRLFELAKLGASEYPVHLRPLPLRQAVLDRCDFEQVTADCTAVADCTVTADPELLGRVLHNLADNSCKYGASRLLFSTQEAAHTVTLFVDDDGPGVPEAQLPNLFEPFFRGDAARTQPRAGSGLGLAVARQSVLQMGGTIRAENRPGGGLRIVIELPLAEE